MMSSRSSIPGIFLMLVGLGLLSTMDAIAKWLIENDIHAVQILAVRSVIIVPGLIAIYTIRGKTDELKPRRPVAQAFRGFVGAISPLAFFIGVSLMPLSTATVIFFSSIFMTTTLSVFFLGEKVGAHRWTAIFVGYLGVLIAMSPAGGGSILGYAMILLGSLGYAFLFVSGRHLSKSEPVASLVLSYNTCVGVLMAAALPWFWSMPGMKEWALIIALAFLAGAGHLCVTQAFAKTEASLLAPLEYSAILWAVLFDYTVWKEMPGNTTWLGAAIIFAGGLYLIHREQIHEKIHEQSQNKPG